MFAYIRGSSLASDQESQSNLEYDEVCSFFEEDVLFLFSTHNDVPKCFVSLCFERSDESFQMLHRLYTQVLVLYKHHFYKYILLIFTNTADTTVAIIRSRGFQKTSGYQLTLSDNNVPQIKIAPEIVQHAAVPCSNFLFLDAIDWVFNE